MVSKKIKKSLDKVLKFFRKWEIVMKIVIAAASIFIGSKIVNNYIETKIELEVANIVEVQNQINSKVDVIDNSITSINNDIDSVNSNIIDIQSDIDVVNSNISSVESNISNDLNSVNQNIVEIQNDLDVVNSNISSVESNISNNIDSLTEIVVSNNNINQFSPTINVDGTGDTPILVLDDIIYGNTLFETQYKNCSNGDPNEFVGTPGDVCFGYTYTYITLDSQKVFNLQQGIASIEYQFVVYDKNDDLIIIPGDSNFLGYIDKYNPTIYINDFSRYFENDIDRVELIITIKYYTNIEGTFYTDSLTISDIRVNQDYVNVFSPAIEFDDR